MTLSNFFIGKKYVSFGDSITERPDRKTCYPVHIAYYFGMELVNCAQSGSAPLETGFNLCNLTDGNLANVDSDTMLVTISGGQNSWVTSDDINTLDRSTSIGAINYYIDKIREVSPMCIIILCPTYIGNGTSQCTKDYALIADNKHVGIAPITDLKLIDWENDKTTNILRPDNVHPSEYGAGRIASVIREYAKNYLF